MNSNAVNITSTHKEMPLVTGER